MLGGNGQFKPWYSENFRAPSDPQQREALWGPVVKTWMTPEDSECKEFGSGAVLCDKPGGATFAHIKKDRVMWIEYPDGTKSWMVHPYKTFHP